MAPEETPFVSRHNTQIWPGDPNSPPPGPGRQGWRCTTGLGWRSPGWRVGLLVRDAPGRSQTLKVAREGQDHAPADGAAERMRPWARAPGLPCFTLGMLWRGQGAGSRDGAPGLGAASARRRAGRGASPRGREEGPPGIGKNLCFSVSMGSVTTFTSDVARRRGSGQNRAPRLTQVWGTSAGGRARDQVQAASTGGSQPPGLDQGRYAYEPLTVQAPAGHQTLDHGPPETPLETCPSVGKHARLALPSQPLGQRPCAGEGPAEVKETPACPPYEAGHPLFHPQLPNETVWSVAS